MGRKLLILLPALAVALCDGCRRDRTLAVDNVGTERDGGVRVTDAGSADSDSGTADSDASTQAGDDAGTLQDGGWFGEVDAGAPDSGIAVYEIDAGPPPLACDIDSGLPNDGGISWGPGIPASVTPPQGAEWIALSDDPECAALAPGSIPSELSFTAPADECVADSDGGTHCYCFGGGVAPDGQGNVAVASNMSYRFFLADGTGVATMNYTYNELAGVIWRGGSPPGWLLGSETYRPPICDWARLVSPNGDSSAPIPIAGSQAPNPTGGYVELATTNGLTADGNTHPALWVRWVDDSFEAPGQWHPVMTWPSDYNNQFDIFVDQQGQALVLSFVSPMTLGTPAPPAEWSFTARWMGRDGPITPTFEPLHPTFTSASSAGDAFFAGWGTLVPLPEGGFVAFQPEASPSSGGTTAPSGWYALYPSGEASVASPPTWLQSYDGSLQLLPNRAGFAAIQHGTDTCARTAVLIGASGRACFAVPLDETNLCDGWSQYFAPGGTLVLLNTETCEYRWWPNLVRSEQ